jgi:hypothetical protein
LVCMGIVALRRAAYSSRTIIVTCRQSKDKSDLKLAGPEVTVAD